MSDFFHHLALQIGDGWTAADARAAMQRALRGDTRADRAALPAVLHAYTRDRGPRPFPLEVRTMLEQRIAQRKRA